MSIRSRKPNNVEWLIPSSFTPPNIGHSVFNMNHKKRLKRLKRFIWRTVKDNRVCPSCLEREGCVLSTSEMTLMGPPLHGSRRDSSGCRCFLEEIK